MAYAHISLNKIFLPVAGKNHGDATVSPVLSTHFAVPPSVPATARVSVQRADSWQDMSVAADRMVRFFCGIAEVDDVFATFCLFFTGAVTTQTLSKLILSLLKWDSRLCRSGHCHPYRNIP